MSAVLTGSLNTIHTIRNQSSKATKRLAFLLLYNRHLIMGKELTSATAPSLSACLVLACCQVVHSTVVEWSLQVHHDN